MIDFQSSAIVESTNHLAHRSPSPGGEGRGSSEHSERLTGCCSGVGELSCSSGRQSALIEVRPCPSGTFENSQRHARVIYGWVHCPQPTQSPARTAEILSCLVSSSGFVHSWPSREIIRVNSRNSCKGLCGGKGRNCETNPILVASFCRSGRSKEKNSKCMISQTHQLLRPCIFRLSHLRLFKPF
jgi:hypothetical protein